jgi:hypothetical protein
MSLPSCPREWCPTVRILCINIDAAVSEQQFYDGLVFRAYHPPISLRSCSPQQGRPIIIILGVRVNPILREQQLHHRLVAFFRRPQRRECSRTQGDLCNEFLVQCVLNPMQGLATPLLLATIIRG